MKRAKFIVSLVAMTWLSIGVESAMAMPIDDRAIEAGGLTSDGRLYIREVADNSTVMEMRLSAQIMVLQRQIDALRGKIDQLNAKVEGLE